MISDHDMVTMRKVCGHFVDDMSKEIYADKVAFCLTGDEFYWKKLKKYTDIGQKINKFSVKAGNKGIVLFGGGNWIRNIFLLGGAIFSI